MGFNDVCKDLSKKEDSDFGNRKPAAAFVFVWQACLFDGRKERLLCCYGAGTS